MTTLTPHQVCDEKARCVSEQDEATNSYSDAVASLRSQAGLCSQAEYLELKRIVGDRRIAMDQASLRLAKHVSEHRCQREVSCVARPDKMAIHSPEIIIGHSHLDRPC
jgi:hypothetical protein